MENYVSWLQKCVENMHSFKVDDIATYGQALLWQLLLVLSLLVPVAIACAIGFGLYLINKQIIKVYAKQFENAIYGLVPANEVYENRILERKIANRVIRWWVLLLLVVVFFIFPFISVLHNFIKAFLAVFSVVTGIAIIYARYYQHKYDDYSCLEALASTLFEMDLNVAAALEWYYAESAKEYPKMDAVADLKDHKREIKEDNQTSIEAIGWIALGSFCFVAFVFGIKWLTE